MCLDDYLYLDENTLKSLSICSNDVHGFVHAKAEREGFSILGTYPTGLSRPNGRSKRLCFFCIVSG